MKQDINLRPIRKEDCLIISEAFYEQGWDKPISQYEKYVQFQETGERDVIVANWNNEFAGYLTINWKSDYQAFLKKGIPEIVDFNVLKKFQRRAIGTLLMDEAEKRIKQVSKFAGIGFGLYQDYGPAQILYIKRGYIPDGNGLIKDGVILKYGDHVQVDDGLVLHLVKTL